MKKSVVHLIVVVDNNMCEPTADVDVFLSREKAIEAFRTYFDEDDYMDNLVSVDEDDEDYASYLEQVWGEDNDDNEFLIELCDQKVELILDHEVVDGA